MQISDIDNAINQLIKRGYRSIKVVVEEDSGVAKLKGTTSTYYEKQLVLDAAMKTVQGQLQICGKSIEVAKEQPLLDDISDI